MPTSQDIKVRVIDGGQKAQVEIPAGLASGQLTPAVIKEAATVAGVRITPAVEARFSEVIREYGDGAQDLSTELAHAVAPQRGHPGTWAWEHAFDPGVAALAEGERNDPPSPKLFVARKGVRVATYTPPTEGVDGQSVTGAVIPAVSGKASAIRPGDGLDLGPNGVVTASHDGAVWVVKGLAQVSPLHHVKGSITPTTGSVNFKGDILVDGSIGDGIKVHASGNIFVEGKIEGAQLVCGGQLVCFGGISSKRRAKVVAGGPTTLGPTRNMAAIFRSHFSCRDRLEGCDVTVGGEFHAETASVVGGAATLTGCAFIAAIGSPQAEPTTLIFGELPLLSLELKRLNGEITRIQASITAKDEAALTLQCAVGGGNTASTREQLTEIQYERSGLARQLAGLETERNRLQEAFSRGRSCEVNVGRMVYPKVRLQHGATVYELDRELAGPVQIRVSNTGEMQVRFPNKEPRPIAEFATLSRPPARKSA